MPPSSTILCCPVSSLLARAPKGQRFTVAIADWNKYAITDIGVETRRYHCTSVGHHKLCCLFKIDVIGQLRSIYRETVFLISCEIRNHCIAKRIGSNPRIVLYPHARCSVSIDKRKSVAQILRERHAMRMDG